MTSRTRGLNSRIFHIMPRERTTDRGVKSVLARGVLLNNV
jgi:hypothetical protein